MFYKLGRTVMTFQFSISISKITIYFINKLYVEYLMLKVFMKLN